MEPQAKRFAGVCDSDVDQVIAGRVPQATKEATSASEGHDLCRGPKTLVTKGS